MDNPSSPPLSASGTSSTPSRYSPWPYIHCGICYLPFINPRNPEAPPPIPFWLTECSHVVCNNHLNANQTCRQCGTDQPIVLMPLQRDLPIPMNMWFSDIPDTLSDLLGAARFQHETLVHLVTFYKGKCATQKELIERLRREVEMLKGQLKQGMETYQVNENGKRRRLDGSMERERYQVQDQYHAQPPEQYQPPAQRFSSPAFATDYRPSRLTLRPGSSRIEQEQAERSRSSPMSLEEFAYHPDEPARGSTARLDPQPSSTSNSHVQQQPSRNTHSGTGSGRFKPALSVLGQGQGSNLPRIPAQNQVNQARLPATPRGQVQPIASSSVQQFVPGSRNIAKMPPASSDNTVNVPSTPSGYMIRVQNTRSRIGNAASRGFAPPTPLRPVDQQQPQQQNRKPFVSGRSQNQGLGLGLRQGVHIQSGHNQAVRQGTQRSTGSQRQNSMVRPDSRMQMPPPPLPLPLAGSRLGMGG